MDVDISTDGKYLAIAEVDINGALIKSSIKVIDIKYQEKGQLLCVYDDSIHMIYQEKETTLLEFDKNVQMASIDLKGYAVRAEEISTGLRSSRTDIIFTNTLSKAETTYSVDSVIKSLTSCNQMVAINLGTEIDLINLNGWLEKKYISTREIKDIALGQSIVGIVYRDRIKILTF